MERLHPGVYIEEVPSGVRPIEGVSTSTVAFLGKADRGPARPRLMVTSFIEFQALLRGVPQRQLPGPRGAPVLQQRRPAPLRRYGWPRTAATADVGVADRKATPGSCAHGQRVQPGRLG